MVTHDSTDMTISRSRAKQLIENLLHVNRQIQAANKTNRDVRLVAVSKLHPASSILALHKPSLPNSSPPVPPHHHFGENYLQELQQKASVLPRTIRWHFIGALQTNKCRPLAQIPNLWCVESVDTLKKADALEKGRKELLEQDEGEEVPEEEKLLRVFVQVNTSGEESKSGAEPGEQVLELCRHVRERCPHLKLTGLMTIGAIARSVEAQEGKENEDFVRLKEVRDEVQEQLGGERLELSMGMSGDFESAIRLGSDEVRVGSGIFGDRPSKENAVI